MQLRLLRAVLAGSPVLLSRVKVLVALPTGDRLSVCRWVWILVRDSDVSAACTVMATV